jgi:DNA repair photolyase
MRIQSTCAKSILTKTSGYIAEAGFTHSLTPARNCTFGCTYCYVPTMGIYGGLKPEDWKRWGQFTTFKSNAAELLATELRPGQSIYCSPLVDPYQPAEADEQMMPRILEQIIRSAPRVFTIQTRGPLILRDLDLLKRAKVRVSFSITTNREDIRRLYEPFCAPFEERIEVVRTLREAGIETYATLAPLLPCDPETLAKAALDATRRDLIGDPLHIRATKKHGATTRNAAFKISQAHHHEECFDAAAQSTVIERIDRTARASGFSFTVGPRGFSRLAL